ncbi:thiosulfate oxidation carrier protein SoxY [Azospirillum sp.]|uniref:thiosulfate oxidation carrier protein SoxY n=1 Tax=Azospirillum sp. TaxID=34012 RepID=UPI002D2B239A|nr:thiosulfate oxidation carrier protein SoxY [Azospirillum sp.]HYD64135.1 thiosulfate oxidation carrier protein SoxY [Azospirillum sp.]
MLELSGSEIQPRASRRAVLRAAGALAAGAGLLPGPAAATPEATRKLITDLAGGAALKEGRIKLDLPQVADNGATVPVSVKVDSPMTAQDHVRALYVLAEHNPIPETAIFRFTPACGEAEVSLRMRLAKTQTVYALAQMSDGSAYLAKGEVKVTVGGCGT